MHKVLQDILKSTKEEVEKRKIELPFEDQVLYPHTPFKEKILNPSIGDIRLIAEVKLASPSAGKLGEQVDVLNRLLEYQHAGADAVSIITEGKHFKGSLDLLVTVKRSISGLPILQKDFIIDDFQIEEAQRLGSDALLLIARIVDDSKLKQFVKLCREKDIEPVVEIFNSDDLNKATESGTEIIAVNARDLDTFEVNVDRACEVLKNIPDSFIKLAFSGVRSRAEVEKYKKAGARAVLVGTQLMRSDNIDELIKELKNVS